MKTVSKFVANDGTEFDSKEKCLKYENLINQLKDIFNQLPEKPNTTGFSNGDGYIQHDKKIFNRAVKQFYKLACEYHEGLNKYEYNTYGFWRFLDDSNSIFYSYGQRFMNTDMNTYREYGQGYFKAHPEEISGGRINV